MENSTGVSIANEEQAAIIAGYQLEMAMETENLSLNSSLVHQAVNYFIKHSQLNQGMYLVKKEKGQVVGSLLLTFQNSKRWWIQSVYISKDHRRQGHFTSLFHASVELAKSKGVLSIKLYAESSNEKAKNAYFKLGMKVVEGKFYSYDFVFGGYKINLQNPKFTIIPISENHIEVVRVWVQDKTNALNNSAYCQSDWNDCLMIKSEQTIIGVAKLFSEFSDWRFGVMKYVSELYLQENTKLGQIVDELISNIVQNSELKIVAVRFVTKQGQIQGLNNGHLEHYDVLQLVIQ